MVGFLAFAGAMALGGCPRLAEAAKTLRATGPLEVHPSNPRNFTNGSGKAISLIGSHTWTSIQDRGTSSPPSVFDYTGYLDFLVNHGHNLMRFWVWEQTRWAPWTAGDYYFSPLPYERTGPGTALDGGPKFHLSKFNQAFFNRLRFRVIIRMRKNSRFPSSQSTLIEYDAPQARNTTKEAQHARD